MNPENKKNSINILRVCYSGFTSLGSTQTKVCESEAE